MKPAPNWIAFAPALFVVLWATGFVVARLSAGHVEPLTFLSIRFPIAGALFVLPVLTDSSLLILAGKGLLYGCLGFWLSAARRLRCAIGLVWWWGSWVWAW